MSKRTVIKHSVDRESQLVAPDLHDAEILGVTAADISKGQLSVQIRTEGNAAYELQFSGVKAFLCHDLYTQNVIREVMVWTGRDLIGQLESYRPELGLSSEGEFKAILERAKGTNLHLVHAVPSVGLNLIVLCEQIEIAQHS